MKHRSWFWGIFFLAAGFFVAASQLGGFVHLGFWSIVATVLLAAALVGSIVDVNFFGILVSAALLYAIYQKPLNWPAVSVWTLLLAAVFVSIGLSIIFHGRYRRHWYNKKDWNCGNWNCGSWKGNENASECIDGDDISISESFNETSKYLHSDCLRQAHLASSFGRLGVYFDGVKLSPEGAEVYVDVSFGKMELYIPRDWRVIDQIHTSAGTVTDSPRSNAYAADTPVLTLMGRVSFGNLDIRYI